MADVRKYIQHCCVSKEITEAELARRMGQSPQNLSNKYRRGTLKVSELQQAADALGADLQILFVDRETGKPIYKEE